MPSLSPPPAADVPVETTSIQWFSRLSHADRTYDMPKTKTRDLFDTIARVGWGRYASPFASQVLDVLDVIREMLGQTVTTRDVAVATWLIGEDYSADDIIEICAHFRAGGMAERCPKLQERHREGMEEVLEDLAG